MISLLKYLKNYKLNSILAPLFKLLEASFELLVPIIVAMIIDNGIVGGEGQNYVINMFIILAVLGVVGFASATCAQYFSARAAVGFAKGLRHDLFAKMQSFSFKLLDDVGTSAMITRITSDVNQIQTGVNLVLRILLRSPFIVFGAMICAYVIDVLAGNVLLITIILLFAVVFIIMFITVPLYKKAQSGLDDVTVLMRQNLKGVRVVRAFCKEDDEIKTYETANQSLTKSNLLAGAISALTNPLTYVIVNAGLIALIYVGAIKVDSGVLTQGQIVALYNYMTQILVELIKFANLIITVTKSFACAGRINEILSVDTSLNYADDLEKSNHYVSFKNVYLSYHDNGEYALEDLSFDVEKGETVGIIGGTGSGKSSLVNLIARFYDATKGKIFVDGKDVTSFNEVDLRNMCGIVPQKAVLFSGTIKENLLWGNENATDEEIETALELACADDVVRSKENGINSLVEQGGRNFSGGQRQRLTIARTLVKKPEILILDDSASALDYATDARLRKNVKSLGYNPTVFIVSQRTSSIMHADKIIVLDDGKMVGYGSHDDLLKNCSIYKEIYDYQYGGQDENQV